MTTQSAAPRVAHQMPTTQGRPLIATSESVV
jgi:hypothetical protein